MKKLFRLVPVVLAAFFVVGLAAPAAAAEGQPMTVKTMKISLWPEYDDSRVLVIYEGEFKDGASFPKAVKFPAQLGAEINQVCALKQPGNEHLCQLYDTLTEGDYLAISYSLPIPTYFLEYYWDGIKGQPDKSFTYKYVSPYAVDRLELEVQQPLKATDFKLSPSYQSSASGAQGLKYYRYVFDNVTAGQEILVNASYVKADKKPSVAKKQASGTGGGGPNYVLVAIVAGVLAVGFIGFMALKRKPAPARAQVRRLAKAESARRAEVRRPSPQQPRIVRQEPKAQPAIKQEPPKGQAGVRQDGGGGQFCSKCGARLEASDAFCFACGEKTRKAH